MKSTISTISIICLFFSFTISIIGYNAYTKGVGMKEQCIHQKRIKENCIFRKLDLESNMYKFAVPDSCFKKYINTNSNSIIFVYGGGECNRCIYSDLELLISYFTDMKDSSLVIFPVIANTKNDIIKMKTMVDELNYCMLDSKNFTLPSYDGKPARFFAVRNKEGNILSYFYPDIYTPDETIIYLKFIRAKYF